MAEHIVVSVEEQDPHAAAGSAGKKECFDPRHVSGHD